MTPEDFVGVVEGARVIVKATGFHGCVTGLDNEFVGEDTSKFTDWNHYVEVEMDNDDSQQWFTHDELELEPRETVFHEERGQSQPFSICPRCGLESDRNHSLPCRACEPDLPGEQDEIKEIMRGVRQLDLGWYTTYTLKTGRTFCPIEDGED